MIEAWLWDFSIFSLLLFYWSSHPWFWGPTFRVRNQHTDFSGSHSSSRRSHPRRFFKCLTVPDVPFCSAPLKLGQLFTLTTNNVYFPSHTLYIQTIKIAMMEWVHICSQFSCIYVVTITSVKIQTKSSVPATPLLFMLHHIIALCAWMHCCILIIHPRLHNPHNANCSQSSTADRHTLGHLREIIGRKSPTKRLTFLLFCQISSQTETKFLLIVVDKCWLLYF